MRDLEIVYEKVAAWCRERGYSGHDPFDALNSRIFQATPLRSSRLARLAWTQAFKRSPINIRALALIPRGRNPKGISLFALAALSRFRTTRNARDASEARSILDDLLELRIRHTDWSAWGYDFDWQGRAFFAPKGTAAIVPTAFAVRALVEAYELFKDSEKYLLAARAACDFILEGLTRSRESQDEICFSYTPIDKTRVYNASLLAAESLSSVSLLESNDKVCDVAIKAARYVVRRQNADGSWSYGEDSFQTWSDSFHTAFILDSLVRLRSNPAIRSEINELDASLQRGFDFWSENFFFEDGWPKYFPDRKHPADAHSAAACVVTCTDLRCEIGEASRLGERVLNWALRELFDERGFFRYQRRRFYSVSTPYMRWSQAWMLYALARTIEVRTAPTGLTDGAPAA